jgi:hypothetical protein
MKQGLCRIIAFGEPMKFQQLHDVKRPHRQEAQQVRPRFAGILLPAQGNVPLPIGDCLVSGKRHNPISQFDQSR